jgi:phosphoglycolate phosphatase-like HAD superfamily hydrolase
VYRTLAANNPFVFVYSQREPIAYQRENTGRIGSYARDGFLLVSLFVRTRNMTRIKNFKPQAIIFDKDGTLIDFDAMWGGWTVHLAEQLQQASRVDVREALCLAMGYDETRKKVLANGMLASNPMARLYDLTIEVMRSSGLGGQAAAKVVEQVWCIPDPVILAKPFTDMRALFGQFTEGGIKIAIATADDRASTQAMVDAFDIEEYISCMACADDGIPSKPAPDMVISLCRKMDVELSNVMVIGDTTSDLKMARAAGAGLAVGVLSGVSSARDLVPFADILIESIDELNEYALNLTQDDSLQANNGLNPDFAF